MSTGDGRAADGSPTRGREASEPTLPVLDALPTLPIAAPMEPRDKKALSNPLLLALNPAAPKASPLPAPPAVPEPPPLLSVDDAQRVRDRIDALVKEARAVLASGNPAEAASLWFEAGRLFEHDLGNVREAAGHYQESHRADPTFLPVIHAARRLFAQLGKWGMAAVLLDEEVKLPGAPVTALLVEKARIHETRLSRAEDAVILYRQALTVDPAYAPAVDGAIRRLTARAEYAEVADVLRRAADAAQRPSQRGAWLLDLGRLYEAHLKDDTKALAAYEEADRVMPGRRTALDAINRLANRQRDTPRLIAILARLAEVAGSSAEAAAFHTERGRLLALSGSDSDAARALELARERSPDDELLLAELSRLYERLNAWEKLTEVLEARARRTRDKGELLALCAEAGALADERLRDTERAIHLYGTCVEADPTYGPALTALGKLFARNQSYQQLSAVYDVQISAAQDPQTKVSLLFKHAELLAERLEKPDSALEKLDELLRLQPGWVPALKMASMLNLRHGRFEQALAVYEQELANMQRGSVDRDQAIFLLEKMAGLIEEKLDDPARAVAVYQRMLEIQRGYLPALRSLGRLYARLGRWDELLQVNRDEIQMVGDQNHIVSLLFKNGEILTDKLGRVDDAIAEYRQALQLMPSYLPALKALGSIYAKTGRYRDLIAMHREEIDVARRKEQRAHLKFVVAQILEEKLDDIDAAVAGYRDVLGEDPAFHPAIRALARIAGRRSDWESLLEVMSTELQIIQEPRDRAVMLSRIADLLDHRLNRASEAVAALENAVKEAPSLLAAHEQLAALHARAGRAEAELAVRERMHHVLPDGDSRMSNLRIIADYALHRLNDPKKARDAMVQLLRDAPAERAALRMALTCSLQLKDYKGAISFAEQLAAIEPSAEETANLWLQVALWKECHLEPPEDSVAAYLKALEYEPDNVTAVRAVERAYVERRAWKGLFALYERELGRQTSPTMQADLSMKMGELAEKQLHNGELALACYERVLQALPNNLPAITRLKGIYGKLGRASDELRMLSLEALTSKDPARAIATLLEVGALQRDKFGNIDAAVDCFKRVLERDALHSQAYSALETLLVAHSRWEELAQLYVHRSGVITEQHQKVELLSKAAHLLGERLKRFGAAADAYERVLALVPTHPGALLQLGHLRFALQEWDGAVTAYTALLGVAADPLLVVPVHFNLGIIFSEHRVDVQRAIQSFTACLAMQPDNREARARLAKCYGLAGSPAQAVATYKQLIASAPDSPAGRSERRGFLLVLARLHETAFSDLQSAAAALEQAVGLADDPGEQTRLVDEVAGLYERSGNLAGMLDATQKQADALATTQPTRAAELLLRNARLQLERKKDLDGAMRTARRGLEIDAGHVELRALLADCYAKLPNQQLLAIEEHRRIIRSGHLRAQSIHALFRGWQAQRAADRAFVAAEILGFIGAADDVEELYFHDNKKRLRVMSDEGLDAAQLTSWVVHPHQRNPVRDILVAVAPDLAKPYADADLEPVDKRLVLKPKMDDSLRRQCDEIARNIGVTGFDVWRNETQRTFVRAYTAVPFVLVVGADITRLHPTREQRFLLGRELMAIGSGHTLLRGLDARGLALLLTAIGRNVDKTFPALAESSDLDALIKRVGSALSRKAKGAIGEAVVTLAQMRGTVNLDAFIQAAPLTEARAGMLLCGAFDTAMRLVARDEGKPLTSDPAKAAASIEAAPRLADLAAYCLSDEYFQARQTLRLAIDV